MQAQDLDKCKRRIIRTVARRLLYEKQPEDVVWEALAKDTGCDCRTLWSRMRSLTIKKLDRLLSADDNKDKIATVAQMSTTDWLLCDLVLVHENVDLIGRFKPNCRRDTTPLCALFTLVQKFDIEGETNPKNIAKKWATASTCYNKHGIQCSPMLLQRRWFQLKEALRENFYYMWYSYKGNQKMIDTIEKDRRPTVLQSAIAKRYPWIVTTPLLKWEELIQKKLVALPEEIEHYSRGFEDIPQTEEDLVLVEPVIETIDLGVDDEQDNTHESTPNTQTAANKAYSVEVQKGAVNIIDTDSDPNEPSTSQTLDGLSNVRILAATHVPEHNLEVDNSDSPEDEPKKDSDVETIDSPLKIVQAKEVPIESVNKTNELVTPVSDEVNTLLKGKLDTIKHQHLKDSVIRELLPQTSKVNTIIPEGEDTDFESNISAVKIDKDVISIDDDDVKVEKIKRRPIGPKRSRPGPMCSKDINEIIQEKAENYVHSKDKCLALSKEVIEQNDTEKSEDIDSIIKNKADEFIGKTQKVTTEDKQTNDVGDQIDDDDEEIDYVHCDMIKSKTMDDIIKEKADQFVCKTDKDVNFDGKISYGSADVEIVDEGIEYVDDGIDLDEIDNDDVTIKNEPMNDSYQESPKFDKKLLMQPIVYTTRLDHMLAFEGVEFSETRRIHLISDFVQESKPKKPKVTEDIISEPAESDSDDEISDKFKVSPTSYLLQKPKTLDYNPVRLCKNPDFNTRLKRLTVGFLSSTRNRALLKELKPMTIDLHKAFEPKLINGTLYLKPGNISKPKTSKVYQEIKTSTVPSAMPIQCLIDNVMKDIETSKEITVRRENVIENKEVVEPGVAKRSKVIRLPNIEEIRRINEKLLTAKVSPIVLENYVNVKPIVDKPPIEQAQSEVNSNVEDITPNVSDSIARNTTPKPSDTVSVPDTVPDSDNNTTEKSHQTVSVSGQNTDTAHTTPTQSEDSQTQRAETSTTQRDKLAHKKAAPKIPWYSNSKRKSGDEGLLTNDTLFKMIYHISGDKDKSIAKTGKKYKLKPAKPKDKTDANKKTDATAVSNKKTRDETPRTQKRKRNKKTYCCYLSYVMECGRLGKRRNKSHTCPQNYCSCCCKSLFDLNPRPRCDSVVSNEQSLMNACSSIELVVSQSNETVNKPHVYVEKGSDIYTSNIKTRIVTNRTVIFPTDLTVDDETEPPVQTSVVDLDSPMFSGGNRIQNVSISHATFASDADNIKRVVVDGSNKIIDIDSEVDNINIIAVDSNIANSETIDINSDESNSQSISGDNDFANSDAIEIDSDVANSNTMPVDGDVTNNQTIEVVSDVAKNKTLSFDSDIANQNIECVDSELGNTKTTSDDSDVTNKRMIKVRNIQDLTSTNKESKTLIVNRVTSTNTTIPCAEDQNAPTGTMPVLVSTQPTQKPLYNLLPRLAPAQPPIKLNVPYRCSIAKTKSDDNFIVIDGSKGQPETPKSVVIGKTRKITHVSLATPKNDKALPFSIGKDNILLSTVIIPGRPSLPKSPQKSPLPTGINIGVSDGDIKYNIDASTVITAEELDELPKIITAVKEQLSGTKGVEHLGSIAIATYESNINTVGEKTTEYSAQSNIIDTSLGEENDLQIANVTSLFGSNVNDNVHNSTSSVTDLDVRNVDKPSGGSRNLLSDLMEMSGISEEDINPAPLQTTHETEPSQTFIEPVPSIALSNLGIPKSTELTFIQSLSDLKYACSKNASFFKLNCSTGITGRIDVRVQKNSNRPANVVPTQTIDLTDENEDKEVPKPPTKPKTSLSKLPIPRYHTPSKPVMVRSQNIHDFGKIPLPRGKFYKLTKSATGLTMLKQVNITTSKSILKKPLLVRTRPSETVGLDDDEDNTPRKHSEDDADLLESTDFEEPTQETDSYSLTAVTAVKAVTMDDPKPSGSKVVNSELSMNVVAQSTYLDPDSDDSSDDEPLAKKVKRKHGGLEEEKTASSSPLEATETVQDNTECPQEIELDSNVETFESDCDEMELDDIGLTFLDDCASSEDEGKKADDDCILGV